MSVSLAHLGRPGLKLPTPTKACAHQKAGATLLGNAAAATTSASTMSLTDPDAMGPRQLTQGAKVKVKVVDLKIVDAVWWSKKKTYRGNTSLIWYKYKYQLGFCGGLPFPT